jgi:hypothetical protein
MIKGVLFDVGGVLFEENGLFVRQSVKKALGIDEAAILKRK